jgi:hypothetical protein
MKALKSELQSLSAKNEGKHKKLAAAGLQIDGMALAVQRLELFIEGVLGEEDRLNFEVEWQKRLDSMLAEAEVEMNRAKLDPRRSQIIRPT